MDRTLFRPDARSRCLVLGATVLASATCSSCRTGTTFVLTGFTILKVEWIESGRPVQDAVLAVRTLSTRETEIRESEPVYSAPTQADGTTVIPVTKVGSEGSTPLGTLRVTISAGDASEAVEVLNSAAAQSVGGVFRLTVIDTDAAAPGGEPPHAVEGTSPVSIEINGYVGTLIICSDQTRSIAWQLTALESFSYIDAVVVGEVPLGFMPLNEGLQECGVEPQPADSDKSAFTAFLSVAGTDELLVERYCVSSDGTVVACVSP